MSCRFVWMLHHTMGFERLHYKVLKTFLYLPRILFSFFSITRYMKLVKNTVFRVLLQNNILDASKYCISCKISILWCRVHLLLQIPYRILKLQDLEHSHFFAEEPRNTSFYVLHLKWILIQVPSLPESRW